MRDTIWIAMRTAELVDLAHSAGTSEVEDQEEAQREMTRLRERIKSRCGKDVLAAIDHTTNFNGT